MTFSLGQVPNLSFLPVCSYFFGTFLVLDEKEPNRTLHESFRIREAVRVSKQCGQWLLVQHLKLRRAGSEEKRVVALSLCSLRAFFALVFSNRAFPTISEPGTG